MNPRYRACLSSLLFALCACGNPVDSGAPPATSPHSDEWLGQWTGPEGTFLRLEGGQGKYTVTIQNLDGPRTFTGSAREGRVQFERDGVVETIRASDGTATGMKWLADKTDCLTIRSGEGYCR